MDIIHFMELSDISEGQLVYCKKDLIEYGYGEFPSYQICAMGDELLVKEVISRSSILVRHLDVDPDKGFYVSLDEISPRRISQHRIEEHLKWKEYRENMYPAYFH